MAATQHTPNPAANPAGDGVDVSVRRARGALFGRHVFVVLIASLALVVIAFAVAFVTNPTSPAQNPASNGGSAQVKSPAVVEQFNAPEPQPKQPG